MGGNIDAHKNPQMYVKIANVHEDLSNVSENFLRTVVSLKYMQNFTNVHENLSDVLV